MLRHRPWPADVAMRQSGIEFDIDNAAAAVADAELRRQGCRVLVGPRTEPWAQEVARLLSRGGLLVGLTKTPWMRQDTTS